MGIRITIDTSNDAFSIDERYAETVRILRELADRLESHRGSKIPLRDLNGNKVGEFEMFED